MLIPIAMPELGMGVVSARVTTWHKQDGESVSFGDVICDVTPHMRGQRDKDRDAAKMMSASRGRSRSARSIVKMVVRRLRRFVRQRRFKKRMTGQDQRVRWEFRLIASEAGAMGAITVGVGSIAGIGEVLATFEAPYDAVPGQVTPAPMRIVTELIDRTAEGAT